jgi:hypothetical protein
VSLIGIAPKFGHLQDLGDVMALNESDLSCVTENSKNFLQGFPRHLAFQTSTNLF